MVFLFMLYCVVEPKYIVESFCLREDWKQVSADLAQIWYTQLLSRRLIHYANVLARLSLFWCEVQISLFGPGFLMSIFRPILRVLNNSPLMYGSEHFYPQGFYGRICSTQRILHGRAEIRNFSASSVEKYFTSERSERVKYLQHEDRNFVSPSGYVIFQLLYQHQ